jgi:phosphoglycerate kinase
MDKLTVRDADVAGRRVLVRVDFNVPLEDGKVVDDARVRAALPTILHLRNEGARVILASHLGRPKGKVVDSLRLRPVAERLSLLLGQEVRVTGDALGVGTQDAVRRMKKGDVLLLENLRFHKEEEADDPGFAQQLAAYADLYVNDAFGSAHRAHASTVGIARYLPAYSGLLMEREITVLSRLLEEPARPFAAVIGGAKVSDKTRVLENLLRRLDTLVLAGGMANTFLVADGHTVGKSLLEADMVDEARRIIALAAERGVRLVLPLDVVVAKEVTRGAEYKVVPVERVPNSWSIVDVGPRSVELNQEALEGARTILWNGPLGVFEIPTFGEGTRRMARFLAARADSGVTVVVGGGDSAAAIDQLGLGARMSHVSTGGGATLEFLEGRELPGVAILLDREPVAAA